LILVPLGEFIDSLADLLFDFLHAKQVRLICGNPIWLLACELDFGFE
jgi:hypothetical protein